MRPPEKFRTATRFCAAHQRYEGRKPEPRAYVQGLDVRTISGRRRDIFLDILFIESNQALTTMSSIKRDVKKKVIPRPEGENILSRDPPHFTVRVPLDLRERFCF